MNDCALIGTGAAGAIVAAVCCATVLGLGAWLARADLVLFALLAGSLGLLSLGPLFAPHQKSVARRRST